jgi:hypothetical protein
LAKYLRVSVLWNDHEKIAATLAALLERCNEGHHHAKSLRVRRQLKHSAAHPDKLSSCNANKIMNIKFDARLSTSSRMNGEVALGDIPFGRTSKQKGPKPPYIAPTRKVGELKTRLVERERDHTFDRFTFDADRSIDINFEHPRTNLSVGQIDADDHTGRDIKAFGNKIGKTPVNSRDVRQHADRTRSISHRCPNHCIYLIIGVRY